jgi:broad specificity phosphatase PhoE
MGVLYLLRHGQAGPRHDYDKLSDLGHAQTILLGQHFHRQGRRPGKVVAGSLRRQQDSARNALAQFDSPIELHTDARWDEFDLDRVYREIGPQLAHAEAVSAWHDLSSPIHRANNKTDALVARAWIEGRYPYSGESWPDFQTRVRAALSDLAEESRQHDIFVFTSATPSAIAIGHALGVNGHHLLRLAGLQWNSSIHSLRMLGSDWALFQYNATPHLPKPDLHTFR